MRFFPRKFIKNKKGGVSVVIGSLLMASILISTTAVLIIISTHNNTRAIERNNLANELHAELLEEMQAFYNYLEAKIPSNPNVQDNNAPVILWAGPTETSSESAKPNQLCNVHVFDVDSDEITIWFYPWGETIEAPLPAVQVQTVASDTNATFSFGPTESGKTYYWSAAICDPWSIPTAELYSFTAT